MLCDAGSGLLYGPTIASDHTLRLVPERTRQEPVELVLASGSDALNAFLVCFVHVQPVAATQADPGPSGGIICFGWQGKA